MTELKRLNRKYRKYKRNMTTNDLHRLEREIAAAIDTYLFNKENQEEN